MNTYPIMLKIVGRRAVVVGGGEVGLRKVRSLLRAGAKVKLIADEITGEADLGDVQLHRGPYTASLLAGAMLVLACTDNRALNGQVAADARSLGALVNVADEPADCDFFLPAVTRDGDVVVAVGTGGTCPALAANLKRRAAAAMPADIGRFAALLGEMREELKSIVPEPTRRGEINKQLASQQSYQAFLAGGGEALRKIIKQMTCESSASD